MTEIAQLFESALRNNRASLLRKAAIATVTKMPLNTTLRELLESDAGEAVRELSLRDLNEALATKLGATGGSARTRRKVVAGSDAALDEEPSREERIYRMILEAVTEEPLTIGQLARTLELEVDELRGYINWMKKMGKIESTGRARATRYHLPR